MGVRPPTDQRREVRQDRVVEKKNVQRLQRRAEPEDEDREGGELPAVSRPELSRPGCLEQVHEPPEVSDEGHLTGRDRNGRQASRDEEAAEGPGVLPQERPEPVRRAIARRVRTVWVHQGFEASEHGVAPAI